jgi:hypothetical protein
MKWVALVTFACIAIYTVVTLQFRKEAPAYRPFQDSKEKATVQRLRSAGFQRITATAERPADGAALPAAFTSAMPLATVTDFVGGLPVDLKETLIDQPRLPHTVGNVRAPAEVNRLFPYHVQFTCGLPDNKQLLAGTHVYVREEEMAIVSNFEQIEGDLLARTREATVLLTLPAGTLHAGTYRVTLVGERGSMQWTLQVH